VADEFIDFYQALELPLEAEPKQIRSRIAQVYTEAQRNLDHRNFQTRVEHQKMFEVVLPRARYILLDDGRRGEYDQLVRAFRGVAPPSAPAPSAPSPPQPASTDMGATSSGISGTPAFGRGDASGFQLAEEQPQTANGRAPRVEGLPSSSLDPAQMARQRDELWQKWKSGLESAIARDESTPSPAPSKPAPAPAAPPVATETPANPRHPRTPASGVAFDFGGNNAPHQNTSGGVSGVEELDEETRQKQAALALERQRTERKREAMKEILTGVGVKATIIGGMSAAFPLGGLLIYLMGRFYPRGAPPQIALPSTLAWMLGLLIVGGAAYLAARYLSRDMRHKKATELSMLSLEDILRELGRAY